MRAEDDKQTGVRIWDLPTRLFHWALVVLIALQFATGEFDLLSMDWHYRFGYATLALIVFRVAWGFAGSQTSRFADFVRGPATVARYVKELFSAPVHKTAAGVGHNPLGGWSVLVMLACLLVQTGSGLFSSDDIDEDGPYVDYVSTKTVKLMTRVHHLGETVLLVLITLHIAAVLLHWLIRHDNLILPMLSGRKRIDAAQPYFVGAWRAPILFALAIAAVALLSWFGSA
ncbi:MAG: cytochrome b/b6 domain-containing protein [Rudaea sp.]